MLHQWAKEKTENLNSLWEVIVKVVRFETMQTIGVWIILLKIAHGLDLDSTISMIWFAHMNKTFSILKSKWNWCFLFMALINLENYGSIVIMIQDIWRVHAIEYKYSDTKYHYVLVLYLCLQYYPKYGNYFDKPLISISD